MYRSWTKILLASLLLLSQSTAIAHDIEHFGSVHGEYCAVYLAQDHGALNQTEVTAPLAPFVPVIFQSRSVELLIVDAVSFYTPRAPPQI